MKRTAIQQFYHDISGRYEVVNTLMTLGMDKKWRREAAKSASLTGGTRWLDMCCGTGDMSLDLLSVKDPGATLFMADFSREMLDVASRKEGLKGVDMTMANAFDLPFKDNTFDLVTISFATRNLNLGKGKLERAFSEVCRILRPGGVLVNLETSQPRSSVVRAFFHLYARAAITPIGYLFTGDRKSYRFLTSSMINHLDAPSFTRVLEGAGLTGTEVRPMLFGAIALHTASKTL